MINRSTFLLSIIISILTALPLGAVTVGAERIGLYAPQLKGKRVGLLSNHTGLVEGNRHTLDFMLSKGVNVTTLFSPEHGFRGTADAGQHVKSSTDEVTGLPIASLYTGSRRGPDPEVMKGLDAVVIDLQDVGTRFYTYHITMLDMMEACARRGIPVIVLDRPNPLGMTVDGPVLEPEMRSGVGRIPVPVLHGMTMGELAMMANGEGWLRDGLKADLTVVPCEGYTHATRYTLPVPPSPNLRTMRAIYLYPSLCYFEGSKASVGRGTDIPFMVYGHPDMKGDYTFTPRSMSGAKNPPLLGKECHGTDLSAADIDSVISRGVDLSYIINARRAMPASQRATFLTPFFDKLIGTPRVRRMIDSGASAEEIRATWRDDVESFTQLRKKYLLYPLS